MLFTQRWFRNITLNQDLIPLDFFNLIITGGVTIYLAWFVTKKLSENRFKKEYLINDLKSLEDQINRIEQFMQDSEMIPLQNILNHLTRLRHTIERFNGTLLIMEINCPEAAQLNVCFNHLYRETTNVEGDTINFRDLNQIKLIKAIIK